MEGLPSIEKSKFKLNAIFPELVKDVTVPDWMDRDTFISFLRTQVEEFISRNNWKCIPTTSIKEWISQFEFDVEYIPEKGFAVMEDNGILYCYENNCENATEYNSYEELAILGNPWDWYSGDFTLQSNYRDDPYAPKCIEVPDFEILYMDLPGYCDLPEKHQQMVAKWNNTEQGFATLLEGDWDTEKSQYIPESQIRIEDLREIGPYLEMDKYFTFFNGNVGICRSVCDFANKSQLSAIISTDIRGQLEVSDCNNKMLLRALEDRDKQMIKAITTHPKFKFNVCSTLGNGWTNRHEDTPVFKFFQSPYCSTFGDKNKEEDTENIAEKVDFLFKNLFPYLTKDDKKIAIAEAFWAGKYNSNIEIISLLLDNLGAQQ